MQGRARLAGGDPSRAPSVRVATATNRAVHAKAPAVGSPTPPTCMQHVTVRDPIGLHLRPAATLAKLAGGFDCEITIHCNGRSANARSLLSILMLQAGHGASVQVVASGHDAGVAVAALSGLLAAACGEPVHEQALSGSVAAQ